MHGRFVGALLLGVLLSMGTRASPPPPALGEDLATSFPSKAIPDRNSTPLATGLLEAASATSSDPLRPGRVASSLSAIRPDSPNVTRGAKEIAIYQQFSPSVVLVLTESGLGSGALISPDGLIVTNYHVVGDASAVGVIFKPTIEGAKVTKANLVRAQVLRFNQVTDLALIRAAAVPPNAKPIALGTLASVMVGADVHAIGHPTGEAWTYTRGIVSQIRGQYEWTTDSNFRHVATVVQTQTPINPGNSGGPLLDNDGRLIGINSFKSEGEALNFAVSVKDVQQFLASTGNRFAKAATTPRPNAAAKACEAKELSRGRSKDPAGDAVVLDVDCDGTPDAVAIAPDDNSQPSQLRIDSNGDGKTDIVALDLDRNGTVDESYCDTDFDGKPDLVGYHRNGEAEPYRFARL